MAADYAALEARVAERHEDTRYLREQSDIHGAALQRLETRLDRHSDLLQEILRRLPPEPSSP